MPPLRLLLAALAATVLAARPLGACVIDVSHVFMPWPPCRADADKLARRMDERNAQILGDVFFTLQKVNEVKREIHLWRGAIKEVQAIEGRLKRVYGDLQVSPLVSLASTYNRTALGSYVRVGPDGTIGFSSEITVAGTRARERVEGLANGSRAQLALGRTIVRGRRDVSNVANMQVRDATDFLETYLDYEKRVDLLTDSVFAAANRRATRYANEKDPEGYVEGVLSLTEAEVSRGRSTAMSAKVRAMPGRQQAVEYLGRAQEATVRGTTILRKGSF